MTKPIAPNSTPVDAPAAQPRESTADPDRAELASRAVGTVLPRAVEESGHLSAFREHVLDLLDALQPELRRRAESWMRSLAEGRELHRKSPQSVDPGSAPGHTCINTTTTLDGSPPPPCPACHTDPEKFTPQSVLDEHNARQSWAPRVGDRVLRHNNIGTIERIGDGDRLNIWVKFDNKATCNYSADELEQVHPLPPPKQFVTVELLLAALDAVGGGPGYGGSPHYALRLLADGIRERVTP